MQYLLPLNKKNGLASYDILFTFSQNSKHVINLISFVDCSIKLIHCPIDNFNKLIVVKF